MKKNNAWNIRRLVDESFVPATQHIILKIVRFLVNSWGNLDVNYCKVILLPAISLDDDSLSLHCRITNMYQT